MNEISWFISIGCGALWLGLQILWVAGLPTIIAKLGTSLRTTAPAPMNAWLPIVIPQSIVAFAPTLAPSPTCVGEYESRLTTLLRGLITLVNTQLGPRKTSLPKVTPEYRLTLFWTLQFAPVFTPSATKQFWPREVPSPRVAPGIM